MENQIVVNEELTPPQPSEGEKPEVEIKPEAKPQPEAGSKTESELLLKSLQEEREKRRILEEELRIAKENASTNLDNEEIFSDEGKVLQEKISSLNDKILIIEEEKNLEKLFNQYPLLRDKADEFKEFRQLEHPKAKLESVAKLYLAEWGLLEPTRKGLEKPTGGTREPFSSGMTAEDVANLRKNNFKEYQRLIKEGKLKFT